MPITSTLSWESDIAAGARKDARALRSLAQAMKDVAEAHATLPSTSGGKLGGAVTIAATTVGGASPAAKIRADAAIQKIEAQSAARNAAQYNAALARLVQLQAKGDQDRARIAAQGAARREGIEAQNAAKLEQIEAAHAAKMAQIAAKAAAAGARRGPAGGVGPAANQTNIAEGQGQSGGSLGSLAAGWQGAVAQAALSAMKQAVGYGEQLLEQGATLAIQATDFREKMVASFEGIGKGAVASERLYKQAIDLAIKLNRDPEILAAEFKRLASSGFKDNQIAPIAKMLADVAAVKGDSKANQLEKLFEKMNAKGSLDTRVITALTNQGFNQNEIYAQLAKALNKPVADIPALIKAGKIDASTAIDSISKVVEKQVGGTAEKLADTIPALIGRIKIAFSTLFDSIDVGPVKGFLKNILSLVTGDLGGEFKSAVGDLFGSIFKLVFGAVDKGQMTDIFKSVIGGIKRVSEFVKDITPGVQGFVKGFIQGFKEAAPILGKVGSAFLTVIGASGGMGNFWQKAGKGIAYFISLVVGIVGVIAVVVGAIAMAVSTIGAAVYGMISLVIEGWQATYSFLSSGIDQIEGLADSALDYASDIGQAIIDGITNAINDGVDMVLDAATDLANKIINKVKSILGIHSPSRAFAEIGMYSVMGFAGGVDTHAHKAAGAVGRMATAAMGAANDNGMGPVGMGAAGGRGGGAVSITIAPGAIVVGAGAAAQAGGDQALARMIVTEIEAWVRRQGAMAA